MGIRATPVSRCLEKKLLLFGFELADVLIVFMFLAFLNLIFGRTDYKFTLVWTPALVLAAVLRLAKRGKPENYIVHWVRFHLRSRALFAFPEPTVSLPLPVRKKK